MIIVIIAIQDMFTATKVNPTFDNNGFETI